MLLKYLLNIAECLNIAEVEGRGERERECGDWNLKSNSIKLPCIILTNINQEYFYTVSKINIAAF